MYDETSGLVKFRNVGWYTNIDHGGRHEPLLLDTMAHNLKFNKKLLKKLDREFGVNEYPRYDNYDALEVPFTESIPSDYDGVMGVPITFMDQYNPDQFRIIGIAKRGAGDPALKTREYPRQIQIDRKGKRSMVTKLNDGPAIKVSEQPANKTCYVVDDELFVQTYARVLIEPKKAGGE